MIDNTTGKITGEVADKTIDEMIGETTDEMISKKTDETIDEMIGETAGETIDEVMDETIVNTTGNTINETSDLQQRMNLLAQLTVVNWAKERLPSNLRRSPAAAEFTQWLQDRKRSHNKQQPCFLQRTNLPEDSPMNIEFRSPQVDDTSTETRLQTIGRIQKMKVVELKLYLYGISFSLKTGERKSVFQKRLQRQLRKSAQRNHR